jgi:lipoprotein NlpI
LQLQSRYKDAIQSYDLAIALKPDYAEAFNNRGVSQAELNEFDAAIASYDNALVFNPDYSEAHSNKNIAASRKQEASPIIWFGAD